MPNNEFGDFQTPLPLARQIVRAHAGTHWGRVLEPTCGLGNFLQAVKEEFPDSEILGIEVQDSYVQKARSVSEVMEGNVFDLDLSRDLRWKSDGSPLLVVGNPPWVTNSQLSVLGSGNRPIRANIRGLRGIDAMTGASNFDIAEYIWLKLIAELMDQRPTISLLCKTQVARNVLSFCADNSWPIRRSGIHGIDARRWFGAAVDACLFTVEVGPGAANYTCEIFDSLEAGAASRSMGVVGGRLVSDLGSYAKSRRIDGHCPLEWRQGVKHDAAAVMELREDAGPVTKSGVRVDIEEEYLFPLLKSTDVFRGRTGSLAKWMVVPQRRLSDDTSTLAQTAPNLWDYLVENSTVLDGRKSSIYRNRSRFCVFGLGDYTFAPYKVAISGLHKSLEFRPVGPIREKPAVFDDTCYFLSFSEGIDCAIVAALLCTPTAKDLLSSMVFLDAKRPVTKKLLQRIDLGALIEITDRQGLVGEALANCRTLALTCSAGELADRISELRTAWRGEADRNQPETSASGTALF